MSVSDEGEEFLRTAVSDGEAGTSLPSPDKGGPVSNEMGYLENPRQDRCLIKWDISKIHARTGV